MLQFCNKICKYVLRHYFGAQTWGCHYFGARTWGCHCFGARLAPKRGAAIFLAPKQGDSQAYSTQNDFLSGIVISCMFFRLIIEITHHY